VNTAEVPDEEKIEKSEGVEALGREEHCVRVYLSPLTSQLQLEGEVP